MAAFRKPVTIMLPVSATDEWKEMYGPSAKDDHKARSLAEAFSDDEEDDDDDDEGDEEEPEEFPDEEPDEGV